MPEWKNQLWFGDNLGVLQKFERETVDLIDACSRGIS